MDKHAIEIASGRLAKRLTDPNARMPIGINTLMRYMGEGSIARSAIAEQTG